MRLEGSNNLETFLISRAVCIALAAFMCADVMSEELQSSFANEDHFTRIT
jgi:hypothetical protein